MFVCFAEDPNALKINHPEEYTAVTGGILYIHADSILRF